MTMMINLNPKPLRGIPFVLLSLRKEKGYTQAEFANLLGISRSFLSEIETGVKNPSVQLLESLSDKLGIPLAIIYLKALNVEDIPYQNREEILAAIKPHIKKIESYFLVEERIVETQ
ncbi:MAG: helix-turn-helix domain-containing protein [Saprospiraceae bacterium]